MGIYFTVTLTLGLQLCFNLFRMRDYCKSRFVSLVGCAILADSLSLVFGILLKTSGNDIFSHLSVICDALVAIFFMLAGFTLASPKQPTWRTVIAVVSPYLVALGILLLIKNSWNWCLIAIDAYILFILFIQIAMQRRYDRGLQDFYSDVNNRHTSWFAYFLGWMLLNMPFYYLLFQMKMLGEVGIFVYFIVNILFYTLLAIMALQQRVPEEGSVDEIASEEEEPEKDDIIQLETQFDDIEKHMKKLIKEEKIYLKADLTTGELAHALQTNTKYLYHYMHSRLHMHFYEYVNGYRIEYAKEKMLNSTEKLEFIALSSGFRSYTTFANVFRKAEGMSPKEWRVQNMKMISND